jgi:glycine/serine hydroxymethyltransferase
LSNTLIGFGLPTVGGGTLNHIVLTDVKNGADVDGARVEFVGQFVNMTVNKNMIPGNIYIKFI